MSKNEQTYAEQLARGGLSNLLGSKFEDVCLKYVLHKITGNEKILLQLIFDFSILSDGKLMIYESKNYRDGRRGYNIALKNIEKLEEEVDTKFEYEILLSQDCLKNKPVNWKYINPNEKDKNFQNPVIHLHRDDVEDVKEAIKNYYLDEDVINEFKIVMNSPDYVSEIKKLNEGNDHNMHYLFISPKKLVGYLRKRSKNIKENFLDVDGDIMSKTEWQKYILNEFFKTNAAIKKMNEGDRK